ncbi:glyoxalase [Brachybacterium sp. P6-10-X1]|uniref:VOC family protein n=1 Tax=unclassified Brachybacterium TaxID=2623841 RepID=UPI0009717C71|nr:VOC family protein [Brachybacterium sp. P6-10-X1]APX32640.1 glyoxalase [Brachybacterium sp. P6-10-X1]
MEQRLSFITLAVADLDRSRTFYVDGLGWEPIFTGGDVLMLPIADRLILSLWSLEGFTAEVGEAPASGVAPITLAHNVAAPAEVDAVLAEVAALGAPVSAGRHREWGGYSGYFSDPDGFRWEVAVNPGVTGAFVLPHVSSTTTPQG